MRERYLISVETFALASSRSTPIADFELPPALNVFFIRELTKRLPGEICFGQLVFG